MKVEGTWRSAPATQAVMRALGDGAYFVGGCVRNALLGAPVADIDIATALLPETVSDKAKNAGLKVIPTGIDHGTVTIVSGGIAHEVTTFRRDVSTDGRHATVAFSDDVEQDARRRDFTMNALYARADGALVDPLGGLPDLVARRVRFIGLPADRIREDYLRILRFFRFTAHYGDPKHGIDAEGLAACAALAEGLGAISKERITHELMRLLEAPDPSLALGAMAQSGVLGRILPGADVRILLPLLAIAATHAPRPICRLAALGGAPRDHLRLSRAQERELAMLRDGMGGAEPAHALAYRHGAEAARDIMYLRAAMFEQPVSAKLETDVALGATAHFPLKAADLSLSGAALGAELKRLEQIWIDAHFEPDKASLLAQAKA